MPGSMMNRLPCAIVVRRAEEQGTPLHRMAAVLEAEGIRVSCCQLGLFGYDEFGRKSLLEAFPKLPADVGEALRTTSSSSGLSCRDAWRWADGMGLPRPVIGAAAETIGLRITTCQLGCFS